MKSRVLCLSAMLVGLAGAPAIATAAPVFSPTSLGLNTGDVLLVQYDDRELGRESAGERRRMNQRDSWELDRSRGRYWDRDDWEDEYREDRELGRQTAGERRRMNQRDHRELDRPRYRYRDRYYWEDRELGRQSAGERARMNQRGYWGDD